MSKGNIVFACGGTIHAADVTTSPVGSRLVVFSMPSHGGDRPVPCARYLEREGVVGKPDLRMNCLIMCPCTVKASGRKQQAVFFEDGTRGRIVTCKVMAHELDNDVSANSGHQRPAESGTLNGLVGNQNDGK